MQTIVTFDWTPAIVSERVAPQAIKGSPRTNVAISKVYTELIQHLFDYGMNACSDRALVKNCIVQCFVRVGARPEILEEKSATTDIFRMFRLLLIKELNPQLHPAGNEMIQELTSLQQEALFLKFHCRLTYRDVARIMDLQIEQLRGLISKAVCELVRDK